MTTGTREAERRDAPAEGLRSARLEWAAIALLSVAAAVVAGTDLDGSSFWADEAATVAVSGHSLRDLFDALWRFEELPVGAVYYVLVWGWMQVFGASEVALRSFSVVMAVATIPCFFLLVRRVVQTLPGRAVAMAVFVLSPYFFDHARDGRTYSLSLLLVVLSTWCFVHLCEERAPDGDGGRDIRGWWIAYVLVSTAAVYAQLFCAFAIVAHAVALLAARPDSRRTRALVRAWIAIGVLVVPLGLYILRRDPKNVDWIPSLSFEQVGDVLNALAGSRVAGALVVGAGVAAGVVLVRQWRAHGRDRATQALGFALALFAVPLALALVVSVVKPMFIPRYLIVILPGVALTVALLADRGRRGVVAAVAAGVLVIGGATATNAAHPRRSFIAEDWRGAVEVIADGYQPGDGIVIVRNVEPFSHYASADERLADVQSRWPAREWGAPYGQAPRITPIELEPGARTWIVRRDGPGLTRDQVREIRSVLGDAALRGDQEVVARLPGVSVLRADG